MYKNPERDLLGIRVKLPPVTISLITQR